VQNGRFGEAAALNGLGELSSRRSVTSQARDYHGQALAIARNPGVPFDEARALEGLYQAVLADATSAKQPPTCGMRPAITRTSDPAPPAASRRSFANIKARPLALHRNGTAWT
jgi:hypothetical protein